MSRKPNPVVTVGKVRFRQCVAARADRGAVPARKPRARAGNGRRAEGDRRPRRHRARLQDLVRQGEPHQRHDARGIGLDAALPIFAEIRETLGCRCSPTCTRRRNARASRRPSDVLQIPAFLCRQTDLLVAAAETGRVVNVKKGQFLAPWDMANVVAKITGAGNANVLVTERGASFGYNTLVSDMRALPILARTGAPVIFDATHSVQQPGGQGALLGRRARVRAGAGARGRRGRRRGRLHRDPSGPRQGALRWAKHDTNQTIGAIASIVDSIRRDSKAGQTLNAFAGAAESAKIAAGALPRHGGRPWSCNRSAGCPRFSFISSSRPVLIARYIFVYTWITPHDEFALIAPTSRAPRSRWA